MPSSGLLDSRPVVEPFQSDVLAGLARRPRRLPCKYFYDQRGSELFDRICQLDEYYLMRTELWILRAFAAEIAAAIGRRACLIELGSGSSLKTRLLFDHLPDLAAYLPVDISREHLQITASILRRAYPGLSITPIDADFTQSVSLPGLPFRRPRRVVYFPGSTIGNFGPREARRLLVRTARLARPGGGLLIGIDLVKDPRLLEAAYNDAAGVTAAFNLNLLARINRELAGTFDLSAFDHAAIYNAARRRIEMNLVSTGRQAVRVAEQRFEFDPYEAICTEYSHKYTIDEFAAMAAPAGLRLEHVWTDPRHWFAVMYFAVD